jgi:hypothetical protein
MVAMAAQQQVQLRRAGGWALVAFDTILGFWSLYVLNDTSNTDEFGGVIGLVALLVAAPQRSCSRCSSSPAEQEPRWSRGSAV